MSGEENEVSALNENKTKIGWEFAWGDWGGKGDGRSRELELMRDLEGEARLLVDEIMTSIEKSKNCIVGM